MNILGISALYHDGAAALVRQGDIVAAAQEGRFSRIRHDSVFPAHAASFAFGRAD
jgi:carbamoyltransferase